MGRIVPHSVSRTKLAASGANPDRISLSGPAGIRLRSSTVQTLAMALHELATNAMKYGGLGQAKGQLEVTWTLDALGPEGEPWLHLDWRESGVDMYPADASRRGAGPGRELIERALPYQLKAKTTYAFMPDGVHCTIAMPVSASKGDQGKYG